MNNVAIPHYPNRSVGESALLAALDARIIELECRVEALTSSLKLYADAQDLATQRGIEAHTLSPLKIRRYEISINIKLVTHE